MSLSQNISNVADIAKEQLKSSLPIDLVGIQDLKLPIRLSPQVTAVSKLSVLVSLEDEKTRGIHMSRLYLSLHEHFSKNIINFQGLKKVLMKAIKSQKGISQSGRIRVESRWPVLRKALKSSIEGWREYPFYFETRYLKEKEAFQYIVGGEVLYSSTCPCSALLSREIIKKNLEETFFSKQKSLKKTEMLRLLNSRNFLSATPHAQKSRAFFKLQLTEKSKKSFSLVKVIDEIEKALGTPVQTAVKREDEAEFARLNASNLMFCEDAVRKLAILFKDKKEFSDYSLRVQHYESLHPFTVESSIVKGLKGGWRA